MSTKAAADRRRRLRSIWLIVVCVCTLGAAACRKSSSPLTTTEYSAVFLTNGQAYFGKLDDLGSAYPVLTDVYYVQSQVNQETKEVKNTLIKRGSEWHAPDRMVINAAHIVFVEPVTAGSTVAKLIDELKKKQQP